MSQENLKILDLAVMAELSRCLRDEGKRIVLCHGTFDLLHTGHIRYLQRSKHEGDVLLVTVTGDEYVNKGPGRPVFQERLRAENLAALVCVDYVAINHAVTAVDVIRQIKPHIYAKGSEYKTLANDLTGNIALEQAAVEEHGGHIFYSDEITFSSSSLLNEHFGIFTQETKDYLLDFRKRWPLSDIHHFITGMSQLNVLIVGDAIIDQYHYVTPLGETGKGNVFAVRYDYDEQFAGGAIAVANHIAGFANRVTLVTALGSSESHESFIRDKLLNNVTPVFYNYSDAPTVTKRRFVDSDLGKLFEVYFCNDSPTLQQSDKSVCQWLEANASNFDLVVVPDFGNGFITPNMIESIESNAKFLAVNTQINSGNRGYHVINRYSRADFVSLNEPELRLAAHNRHDPLEIIAEQIGNNVCANQLAVTRGTHGAIMFDRKNKIVHNVPALSTRVIDRVGAGDAFLSLAGISLGHGLPADVAAFLASAAAAIDVQIVCNRQPIGCIALKKYTTSLLK